MALSPKLFMSSAVSALTLSMRGQEDIIKVSKQASHPTDCWQNHWTKWAERKGCIWNLTLAYKIHTAHNYDVADLWHFIFSITEIPTRGPHSHTHRATHVFMQLTLWHSLPQDTDRPLTVYELICFLPTGCWWGHLYCVAVWPHIPYN